ncbi:tetratricopeptide repeat protein [Microcoleus sp. AT9b-C3]|uniref:tetratricopeptide repeat protein n=1 Tax=unclassified Microcoleus TaxID=2642155 RepID=UPI002FD34724
MALVKKNYGDGKRSGRQTAKISYRKAIEIRPEYSLCYCGLGNALMSKGAVEEAPGAYRSAIELNPDFSESHNKLGDALAKVGRIDEASACYRRALELKAKIS